MNRILTALSLSFASILSAPCASTLAFAEESPFVVYEKMARNLAEKVAAADAQAHLEALVEQNAALQELGMEIMGLYGAKFDVCAAQYADFKAKVPLLATMTEDEIHSKYHDGEDLPAAPGHCYFGRALVVHPAMSAVRLADGTLSSEDVQAVRAESLEVASHVKTVSRRLQAP